MNYDKRIQFEAGIAAGDYIFVDSSCSTAPAADQIAYEVYPRLLPRRTEPYRLLSIVPEYAEIPQNGTWNTVSIIQLAMLAIVSISETDPACVPRAGNDTNPAIETLVKNEENSHDEENCRT